MMMILAGWVFVIGLVLWYYLTRNAIEDKEYGATVKTVVYFLLLFGLIAPILSLAAAVILVGVTR